MWSLGLLQRICNVFVFSEPTKVARRYLETGEKVRISKLTGNVIPKPDPLVDKKPRSIGMLYIILYIALMFFL